MWHAKRDKIPYSLPHATPQAGYINISNVNGFILPILLLFLGGEKKRRE